MSKLVLHGYWRSGTSYRVRIALALKGLTVDQVGHDLRTGEQRAPTYLALNPQGLVPALEIAADDGGGVLTQSPAILEWLEERHPDPPLLPATPADRAIVRAMAAIVACDIHPLNNLRVIDAVRALGGDPTRWAAAWIDAGFGALEAMIARHGDGFAFGATPTLADCHLVPQVYSAERFGVDLSPYPRLTGAAATARALPAVAAAHPDVQPDADR